MAVAPRKRTAKQLSMLERREKVARLLMLNYTYREVAEKLGIGLATVTADVEAAREAWKSRAAACWEEHRAVEVAKIDMVEREALEAWEKSKDDAVTETHRVETQAPLEASIGAPEEAEVKTSKGTKKVKLKAGPGKGGHASGILQPLKEVEETKRVGQCGDPRFLEVARGCQNARMKIFGVLDERNVNVNQTNVAVGWDTLVAKAGTAEPPKQVDEVEARLAIEQQKTDEAKKLQGDAAPCATGAVVTG